MFKFLRHNLREIVVVAVTAFIVFAFVGLVLRMAADAQLLQRHLGGAAFTGPINPGSVAGLAMWYDPSDTTTVFTDTACSVPAVNGNTVACIKDKGPNACTMTDGGAGNEPTLTVVSSSVAFLTFSGTKRLQSSCTAVVENVPRAIAFIAAQDTASATTPQGPVLWAPTNTSGASRFTVGYAIPSSGAGWGLRGRALDSSSGVTVAVGATSSSITELRGDIEYINAGPNMTLITNPGATTFTGTTADPVNNTSPTPSATFVTMGASDDSVEFLTGNVYQILFYVPASAMPGATANQLDTYTCSKAGISC